MSTRDGFHHSLFRSSPYSRLYLFFSLSDLPPFLSLSLSLLHSFHTLFPFQVSEKGRKKRRAKDRSSMSSKLVSPYFSFEKILSHAIAYSIYKARIIFIRLLFIYGRFEKSNHRYEYVLVLLPVKHQSLQYIYNVSKDTCVRRWMEHIFSKRNNRRVSISPFQRRRTQQQRIRGEGEAGEKRKKLVLCTTRGGRNEIRSFSGGRRNGRPGRPRIEGGRREREGERWWRHYAAEGGS